MNGLANGVFTGDRLLDVGNGPWVDWSEQAIITGWSAFTTKQILYKIVGNVILFNIRIVGTSNSATTSITLPFISKTTQHGALAYHIDNGSNFMGGFGQLVVNTNSLVFWKVTTSGNVVITSTWTASGTKAVDGNMFFIL